MWKVQNDSTPCSNARCQKIIKLAKSAYLCPVFPPPVWGRAGGGGNTGRARSRASGQCLPSSARRACRAGAAQYSRDSGIVIVRNQAGRDKKDRNNILNI